MPSDRAPRITAPVSRSLGAVDVDRAVRFWRDVLGFEPQAASGGAIDLVSGAARVRLGARDWPPDRSGDGRSPGAAIVFLETDDVAAMRELVRRRGGAPTELEDVNGIKMRMFEVRDPDGHVVWFGQSYDVESPPRPRAMMERAMPGLPHGDVAAGVRHYRDVLGFSVNYEQHDLGVLDRDEARVLVIARTPLHSGVAAAYFYVRDADALYAELRGRGADVQGAAVSHPWGLREFIVVDAEGNRLTFGQPFE